LGGDGRSHAVGTVAWEGSTCGGGGNINIKGKPGKVK
jgi:hypothetical protein